MRLLFISAFVLPFASAWVDSDCNMVDSAVRGNIVDAICADNVVGESFNADDYTNSNGCKLRTNAADCGSNRCYWDDTDPDTNLHSCKWNRDAMNNVCVHPPAGQDDMPTAVKSCNNILNGLCPQPWEVPEGCCADEYTKYEMLLIATPGFVCCNAPCTSLDEQNQANAADNTANNITNSIVGTATLNGLASVTTMTDRVVTHGEVCSGLMGSTNCAPGMRSYMVGMAGVGGGLMDYNMQRNTLGMYAGRPYYGGQVTRGYGGQSYKQMMQLAAGIRGMNEANYNTKQDHIDEISIDDFMDVMIDALDTDADVFEADHQMISDPWFGKLNQQFSLPGIKFGDHMRIVNDIYGNPIFGVPGFGGYGYGMMGYGGMRGYGMAGYGGMRGYGGMAGYGGMGGYGGLRGYGMGGYGVMAGYGGMRGYGGYGRAGYGGMSGYGRAGYGGIGGYGASTYARPGYARPAYGQPGYTPYPAQPGYGNQVQAAAGTAAASSTTM